MHLGGDLAVGFGEMVNFILLCLKVVQSFLSELCYRILLRMQIILSSQINRT